MTGDFAFGFAVGFFSFAAMVALGGFVGRFIGRQDTPARDYPHSDL